MNQAVPLRWIGPIHIAHPFQEAICAPLATYETTLWPSVSRGARISALCGGIRVDVSPYVMTRSILVEATSAMEALNFERQLRKQSLLWQNQVRYTSHYAVLSGFHIECVGPLIFLRLAFETGDAAGHNMVTKAAEAILKFILQAYPSLKYVSLSSNYCTDKKTSAVNGLLGRGFRVCAELVIDEAICQNSLRTTPKAIEQLHIKKNLIGSILAGSLRSANAHYANMLLAFFLATGQDGANIIEGSQGITHAYVQENGSLAFSCTLTNLILGSCGHGKSKDSQVGAHLKQMKCLPIAGSLGSSSKRLVVIAAAVVLCGELSLMAALTNPGELMRAHAAFERRHV